MWLRPDLVALLLVVLGFWLFLPRLVRNSVQLGFPIFCRSGQREASLEEFDAEVEVWLPLLLEAHLPPLTGADLAGVVRRESATAGSLDVWGWRELKVLPEVWFAGLACILSKVEEIGFGRMVCWMLTLL